MKRIMQFLAAPIFADDEEKTRHAYLLNGRKDAVCMAL